MRRRIWCCASQGRHKCRPGTPDPQHICSRSGRTGTGPARGRRIHCHMRSGRGCTLRRTHRSRRRFYDLGARPTRSVGEVTLRLFSSASLLGVLFCSACGRTPLIEDGLAPSSADGSGSGASAVGTSDDAADRSTTQSCGGTLCSGVCTDRRPTPVTAADARRPVRRARFARQAPLNRSVALGACAVHALRPHHRRTKRVVLIISAICILGAGLRPRQRAVARRAPTRRAPAASPRA